MKILLPVLLIISIIFNFNMLAMAAAVNTENITITQTPQAFLTSDK